MKRAILKFLFLPSQIPTWLSLLRSLSWFHQLWSLCLHSLCDVSEYLISLSP